MTLVENDDVAQLWTLVGELSAQIAENRERTQALQQQADELKGQALHATTGYALRRFNVDISKEKFESELERINAQLVYENNILAHENKQTALLLREYEHALETVMAKFRAFTHATQTHTLQMTSYYESLLSANAHAAAEAQLHASTSFNGKLTKLGDLVRTALRATDGEVEEYDEDDEEGEHYGHPQPFSAQAIWSDAQSIGSNPSSRSKSSRQRPQAFGSAGTDPRWFGVGGGYTGKDGDPAAQLSERALERLTEEERLRYENEVLRSLLGIQDAKSDQSNAAPGPSSSSSPAQPEPVSRSVQVPQLPAYALSNAIPPAGTPLLGIRSSSHLRGRSATSTPSCVRRHRHRVRRASSLKSTPSPGNAPYLVLVLVLVLVRSVRFVRFVRFVRALVILKPDAVEVLLVLLLCHFAICLNFLPDAREIERQIDIDDYHGTGSDVDPQRGRGRCARRH
ncbi:unnamed protein product [Tilletia controversa]|nr:unnamed protein product [Tilletia controversa]